jgi:hypothetical protein
VLHESLKNSTRLQLFVVINACVTLQHPIIIFVFFKMVLPQISYNRNSRFRRRLEPGRSMYEYENRRVHQGREARRARTVRVQSLPRSMRPPEERTARANALARATRNARHSVYSTLSNMNNALMAAPSAAAARVLVNLTKAKNKARLSRYAENAITAMNLFPAKVVVEVRNKENGNKQYMAPNTFKQFLRNNGVYVSPFSRNPGMFKIVKAMYTNNKKKTNNANYLKKGLAISRKIAKNRKKFEKAGKIIPSHLVGRPNTSGNAAFARSLA